MHKETWDAPESMSTEQAREWAANANARAAEPTMRPELVEIPAPGSTPELSDVPIYEGDARLAWRVLAPGEYLGTGGLDIGTDAEWLEDVVLTVTESSSSAAWARHRMDDESTPGVCRCGAAGAPSVIHFG